MFGRRRHTRSSISAKSSIMTTTMFVRSVRATRATPGGSTSAGPGVSLKPGGAGS